MDPMISLLQCGVNFETCAETSQLSTIGHCIEGLANCASSTITRCSSDACEHCYSEIVPDFVKTVGNFLADGWKAGVHGATSLVERTSECVNAALESASNVVEGSVASGTGIITNDIDVITPIIDSAVSGAEVVGRDIVASCADSAAQEVATPSVINTVVHGTGDTLYSKILHYASGALGAVGTLVLNHPVATVFIATATAGIVAGLAAYMCKHRSNGGDQAAVTRVDGDQNVNENDTHDTSNVTNAKASRDGEPYTI